jgi:hypothetical protein
VTTASPPIGYVRISSSDPPISMTVRLAEDRPNVTAGYGGWAEVARPRRRPLSVWVGSPGLRMDLGILLDQWKAGASVERRIAQLEQLATPTAADGNPPRIRLAARGGAVPHQGRAWVIDSIAWGDALMNRAGDRARQQATLSLLEYIADVRVTEKSASARRRRQTAAAKTKGGAAQKRIVASHGRAKVATKPHARASSSSDDFGLGEDLLSIAARVYGDADRWVEIAQLNGLRDPRAIRPGQVLRLP